ncbi:hypothetical protein NAEGRDRAFT_81976 [Naegleria gruberi]|uniref:Uncharacterized protein n=1 Tax=Naegleria gruberi TaxID=5762 RepID=D2W0Y3_NAEGR|nr:uncharacterized protein NAEGRDRAFT_81976 [Naegleria gruberi]EFC37260.1 hypothetical protein NAEGRDRAFT_81976 [Naegleria gruberi]|eukprot:XP_002670004.1 hypothetical protein NAEGRDRAFT_81976 [Naegleria gruberi strain NEG-M]
MRGTVSIIMIIILLFCVGFYAFYSTITTGSLLPRHVLDSWSRRANLLNGNIPSAAFSVKQSTVDESREIKSRLNSLPSSQFKKKIIERGDLSAHVLDRSIYNTFVRYQSGSHSDSEHERKENDGGSDSIVISSFVPMMNGYERLILSECKNIDRVNGDDSLTSRHVCYVTSNLKKEGNDNLACVILREKGLFTVDIHNDMDSCWKGGKDSNGSIRISYFGEGSFSSLLISMFSVFVVLTFGGVMIFMAGFSIFLYVFLRINLFDFKIDQS